MAKKIEMEPSFNSLNQIKPTGINPYHILGFVIVAVLLYSFILYGTETAKQKNNQYCIDNEFRYYGNDMREIGGQKVISCCKLIIEGKIILNETCSYVIYDVNESNSFFGGLINGRKNTANGTA